MWLYIRAAERKFKEFNSLWNKDERLAGKRLLKFLNENFLERAHVEECLQFIFDLKLAAARKEISFLVQLLEMLGENRAEVDLVRRSALRKLKSIDVNTRPLKLPTREKFRKSILNLVAKGRFEEILFLSVVLSTGRRGIDVARLQKQQIFPLENSKFMAKLKFDKRSVKPTCFIIDFAEVREWLDGVVSVQRLNEFLLRRSNETGDLFKKNIQKNLGRFLEGFNLHALRTIKAVWLILQGHTQEEVTRRIGWTDDKMIIRYLRADPAIFATCQGIDEAIVILKEFF